MNPRNTGRLEGADGRGCTTSASIEDFVEIGIWVDADTKVLQAVRFRAGGCPGITACSSVLTGLLRGLTLPEALAVTQQDLTQAVGGLPPSKEHCAELPLVALRAAIEDYQQRLLLHGDPPTGNGLGAQRPGKDQRVRI